MKLCINIGCGSTVMVSNAGETWTNLDIHPGPGVDIVRDVCRGIPAANESFDYLLADNFIEHVDPDDVVFLINEFFRVLKRGGTCKIIVPDARSQGAFQDPTHKSFFVPRSCLYWNKSVRGGEFVGITAEFSVVSNEVTGSDEERFINFVLAKA